MVSHFAATRLPKSNYRMFTSLTNFWQSIGIIAMALFCGLAATQTTDNDQAWDALKKPGTIVLFRHAIAPGGGDPAGFALNDCKTQRNLDEEGRAQARRLGEGFRKNAIQVDAVLTSQWCRTKETAQIAFAGLPKDEPSFNSFISRPDQASQQTEQARKLLLAWRGSGVLVVVTHQVNITALTKIFPASGEGIILHKQGNELKVVARLTP
jgi:phosphohistidine phosphatase SixA